MHSVGLVHNFLHLSNIMMDEETSIIIDFDSCQREGEKLGAKAGNFEQIDFAK
jgi:tRNA A-37 threonylcarbamoyl transferase component Bud32